MFRFIILKKSRPHKFFKQKKEALKDSSLKAPIIIYLLLIAACAAASRAMGTRYGEQDT